MEQEKDLSEILDQALDGGLDDIPEELKGLLSTADKLTEATKVAMSDNGRREALGDLLGRTRQPKEISWTKRLILRPAAALLATFLVVGPATGALAQGASPDDTLYGVKLATENIQVILETDQVEDARLHMKFANARLDEVSQSNPKAKGLSRALENFETHLTKAEAKLAGVEDEELQASLDATIARNVDVLTGLVEDAGCDSSDPEAGKPQCKGLLTALENSSKHLDEDHPSNKGEDHPSNKGEDHPGSNPPVGGDGRPGPQDPPGLNENDDGPDSLEDPRNQGRGSGEGSPPAP